MASQLLTWPVLMALDADGAPIPYAQAFFYRTTTTTHQEVYTEADLGQAHEQPVEADQYGRFPPIFLDGAAAFLYRMVLKDADGVELTGQDFDPLNSAPEILASQIPDDLIDADMLAAGVAASNLGVSGAVDIAGDTMTGPLRLDSTPASVHDDQAGYIGTPTATKTDNYPLVLADAGWMIRMNSASAKSITIPTNASVGFPVGTMIGFRNVGAGVLTIASSAPVSVLALGSGTPDVAWDIAQYGEAWIRKDDTDTWFLSGIGVT